MVTTSAGGLTASQLASVAVVRGDAALPLAERGVHIAAARLAVCDGAHSGERHSLIQFCVSLFLLSHQQWQALRFHSDSVLENEVCNTIYLPYTRTQAQP